MACHGTKPRSTLDKTAPVSYKHDVDQRKKRAQRAAKRLEKDIENSLNPPGGGQYLVFNRETKEKTRGLSLRQAEALWRKLGNAIILPENPK